MDCLKISVMYDQRARDSAGKMGLGGMARSPQLWVRRTLLRRVKGRC
jgi:hypothetical protein